MSQIIEETFDLVLCNFRESQEIDLSEVSFMDPYGMVGLLEIGELLKIDGIRKTIILPQSGDALKYLERMDFFRFAEEYFDLDRGLSPFTDEVKRSRRMGTVPILFGMIIAYRH